MGVDPLTIAALTTIALTALKGAAIGGVAGGVGGAITGGPQGALKGAAIGAAGGALTGGVSGAISSSSAGTAAAVPTPGTPAALPTLDLAKGPLDLAAQPPVAPPPSFGEKIIGAGEFLANSKLAQGTAGAVAGAGASKLLAGSTKPASLPAAPSSLATGDAAAQAAERERRRRHGQGRASTLLTGPLGTQRPANVGAKILLGQ